MMKKTCFSWVSLKNFDLYFNEIKPDTENPSNWDNFDSGVNKESKCYDTENTSNWDDYDCGANKELEFEERALFWVSLKNFNLY